MADHNFYLHDAVHILRSNGTTEHADACEWAVAELERLRAALRGLYDHTADYIRINHLGDVHHNAVMKRAAEALGPNEEVAPSHNAGEGNG